MHHYASHGFKEFLVACGYKGEMIKEYFKNIAVHESDFFVDLRDGSLDVIHGSRLDWQVGLVDTGLDSMTGGRLLRLRHLAGGETCMATYGDGLSDVDLTALLAFHRAHGKLATVTAVRPPARFGGLRLTDDAVTQFSEKPQAESGWINGGFFVFEPGVFDYIGGDETILERDPLERLSRDGNSWPSSIRFFQPMDTCVSATCSRPVGRACPVEAIGRRACDRRGGDMSRLPHVVVPAVVRRGAVPRSTAPRRQATVTLLEKQDGRGQRRVVQWGGRWLDCGAIACTAPAPISWPTSGDAGRRLRDSPGTGASACAAVAALPHQTTDCRALDKGSR
jgi:glucose-1-phosphate cytidylyltransferase